MSSVHHVYPRFLCRSAVTDRCVGAPAPPHGAAAERRRAPARRRIAAVAAPLLLLLAPACSDADAGDVTASDALRFEGAVATLDLLGEQVLAALTRADTAALERVRLTEREHNDVVWPELPASAPEVNFPLGFAWQNIETRNLRALRRIVPIYRSRDLGFQRVECRGGTQTFETFHVLTDCWIVFNTAESPQVYEAQLFEDVLVRGGGHKIFRYYDEEPRSYRGVASS